MECCFVPPFLLIWVWAFSCGMRIQYQIAPRALARWADQSGYRIEQQRDSKWLDKFFASRGGAFQRIYRVKVRTPTGETKDGWVCLGSMWWPCVSVEECPVEVQWKSQVEVPTDGADLPREQPIPPAPSVNDPLWDRELD